VREFLQHALEKDATALLGRGKHDRRRNVSPGDPLEGSRNGHGKPRKFSMLKNPAGALLDG
jgi:hypothetical protein